MSPSAAPPTPQEIQRKLSVHSVSRPPKPQNVSGTESDSDSINITADVLTPSGHASSIGILGGSLSQPPLSSIAERRSGSEEDSEEEDVAEGGWKTSDIRDNKPRGSVDDSVIKSGYLWKKGERRKTWKKRWFVLRTAHLAYYKTSAEYQLLRLLELSDVHSCTQVTLKRHENTFGLISPTRTFYLQASSPEEVYGWVQAIEDARQALMATSTQNSATASIPIPTKTKENTAPPSPSLSSLAPPPKRASSTHIVTSSDSEDASPSIQRAYSASSPTRAAFALAPSKSQAPSKDPAKVILSGYLMKCGSKRRNWRKRWFVLTGEKLMYSGSHMDTKTHRQFPFSEILDALEYDLPTNRQNGMSPVLSSSPMNPSASEENESHGAHTFKIITTKRTLLLCAPGEEDEIKWLGAGSAPAHASDANPSSSGAASSGGNVGIKGKVRRLSVGGGGLSSGTLLEDARETRT
ncbi:hypothetical protein BDQ17DRAFT_1350928 [Cyathus striatus]|nr:hypothetical protein BDQ17DRAFT_1350928 [Cyathus striatus]